MVIAAHFDESLDTGQARDPRRVLRLEALGLTGAGDPASVLIHNISASGLLVESPVALVPGERIDVDLPHGVAAARVIWASGSFFGCQFDAAISTAALSAAQLRGELAEAAPHRPPLADESFPLRLQRLRKARGMTLAQLASEVGVSKPTVWAWEHGKAHPVEGRIEVLAQALDVPAEEMLVDRGAQALSDLIARAKAQIASALGVTPEKVRIAVDL